MPWAWDAALKRYRDQASGRFLSRAHTMDLVRASRADTRVASDQLAAYVSAGSVTPGDWAVLMRQEIKKEYIRQYLAATGGMGQMGAADWGRIGGMLQEQYKHLPGFEADVRSGALTQEQIASRAGMYIESSWEGYERAHGQNAEALGCTEEVWEVDASKESCEDCLAFKGMGWQPIGTFPIPGAGHTKCLTNCGCAVVYRNPETGAQY